MVDYQYINVFAKSIKLNISKNTDLQSLDCRNNQLSILDVSTCKKLINLKSSGNPNLKSIIVYKYYMPELYADLKDILQEYGDIITYTE